MTPCISQATILSSPFESDAELIARAGWPAAEIWLTKLETYLANASAAEVRKQFDSQGVTLAAASAQGGLLLSQGQERTVHWDHFRRRLALLEELGIPRLIVAADATREATLADFHRAAESLAEAAAAAAKHQIQLALEFQRGSAVCSCIETALALVAQAEAPNLGICLDVFHYYTGPSKFEDLFYLTPQNLAWVQISDVSGTPRELARDSDRVLPGDGDFQLIPMLDHLKRIGYGAGISLEILNPQLWSVAPDRVADFSFQALERLLHALEAPEPSERRGP